MKKKQISTQSRLKSLSGALLFATCCGVGATVVSSGDASAAVRNPSVTLTVGNVACNGSSTTCTELTPGKVHEDGSSQSSFRNYYVPVQINSQDVSTYTIAVNAKSAEMVGTNNANNKLKSIAAGEAKQPNQMNNEWGYRWNFGTTAYDNPLNNFTAMPTTSTQLDLTSAWGESGVALNQTAGQQSTRTLTLGFGANVDGSVAADTYKDEVVVSVVATPITTTMFDLTYMQEMKSDICDATTTPAVGATGTDLTGAQAGKTNFVPEKTLVDNRDGRSYIVRKLADGNCWMAQNLELDLLSSSGAGSSYYSGTTHSSGTAATDYNGQTVTTNNFKSNGKTFTLDNTNTDLNTVTQLTPTVATQKYSTAGRIFATATGTRESSDASYGWMDSGADGMRSYSYAGSKADWAYSIPQTTLSSSNALRFTSAAAASTVSVNNVPIFKNADNSMITANMKFGPNTNGGTSGEYMRYGNLYNWTAATLGSGASLTTDGAEAQDSICPKGWKLPSNSGDTSFANLLGSGLYNVQNSTEGYNKINNWPLNFLRTGYYYRSGGYISGRVAGGVWWSTTAGSATLGHLLSTYPTSVFPQNNYYRGYGFAVRCVVREG